MKPNNRNSNVDAARRTSGQRWRSSKVAQCLWVAICLEISLFSAASSAFADPVSDYNLAVQFYKQKRWKLAADACEEFIESYPAHNQVPAARLYWGQALVHLRDFSAARRQFEAYLETPGVTADRALAKYRIGEASYFLNEHQLAEQQLAEFLEQHPGSELAEWASVYLAHSQFQLGRYKQAIASFDLAIRSFPESQLHEDAEYGRARAYEVDGQLDQAIEQYQRLAAEEQHAHRAEALFHLAAIRFSQGDYQAADETFQQLANSLPQHRLAGLSRLNAGYALYQLKKFEQAIARFEAAAQSPEHQETAAYWTGMSYKSLGDYPRAVEVLQASLDRAPEQALAENLTFQLADARMRMGDYETAIEQFEQVYSTWPQGEYADDALHSACDAALQAGNLTQAAELHQLFTSRYADGGLAQIQNLLHGRILIAMGDEAAEDENKQKQLYEQAVDVLKNVLTHTTIESTEQLARFQLGRAYERLQNDGELVAVLKPVLVPDEDPSEILLDSLLLVANAHLRQKRFESAIALYEHLLQQASVDDLKRAALAGLISAQIALHAWDDVKANLAQLQIHDPADLHVSRLNLAAGDAAFEQEAWAQAEEFFKQASRQVDGNEYALSAISGLGHSQYKQERYSEAAQSFERLGQAAADKIEVGAHAAYMLGTSLKQAGETAAALVAYQSGLDKYQPVAKDAPHDVRETLYNLAKAAARTARDDQQVDVATKFYQVSYETLKDLPQTQAAELDKLLFEWADLHYNDEQYERADELFGLLIEETPQSDLADDAALILAESLRFSEKTKDAVDRFRELATSETADDFVKQRALVHLVDLGAQQQKWAEVIQDAETLRSRYPGSEHEQYLDYRRAEALVHTDQWSDAANSIQDLRSKIEQTTTQRPQWWEEVWLLQAQIALRNKDYQQLTQTVEDLRTRSPDSKVLHRGDLLLGRGLENQAQFDQAREAYARVIDSESGARTEYAAEAQFRLAESYLKQENFDAALKEYYRVYAGYDVPAYQAVALYQAARCDLSLKNWQGAYQSFEMLINEFPENEYVEDAKKQMAELVQRLPELKRESS